MFYSKITKIILWIIFGLFFAASLYFNYLYLRDYINAKNISKESKVQQEDKSIYLVSGKIVSVKSNKIIVNDGKKDEAVEFNEKTELTENFIDPSSLDLKSTTLKIIDINNTLKENDSVNISCIRNSSYKFIANKIEHLVKNYLSGIIKSIKPDIIQLEILDEQQKNKLVDVKISDKTLFYKSNIPTSLILDDSQTKKSTSINYNDLSVDQSASAIFAEDINNKPDQIAASFEIFILSD